MTVEITSSSYPLTSFSFIHPESSRVSVIFIFKRWCLLLMTGRLLDPSTFPWCLIRYLFPSIFVVVTLDVLWTMIVYRYTLRYEEKGLFVDYDNSY